MRIGVIVLNLLEAKQMSQKEFADKLNMPTTTLNGYIKRGHSPDYATLKRMASILGVSTDYLLEFDSSNALSINEHVLVNQYRKLDESQKELILSQVNLITAQNNRKS